MRTTPTIPEFLDEMDALCARCKPGEWTKDAPESPLAIVATGVVHPLVVDVIKPLVAEVRLLRKMVGYGIAHGHVCSIFKPPGKCDCGLVDLLRPDRKLGEAP